MKRTLYYFLFLLTTPFFLLAAVIFGVFSRLFSFRIKKPRLVWGSSPIINNSYWSRAMRELDFPSETFTHQFFSVINKREDWDRILEDEYRYCPRPFRKLIAFAVSLMRYDVFVVSCRGFFLGDTPLWRLQVLLLKIAGKKTVLIPYGSDAYCYRRIRSTSTIHALMMSYPDAAKKQREVCSRLDYWCRHADVVIPGSMGPDGFGRWDVLSPSSLCIDLKAWKSSKRMNAADGIEEVVRIAHVPNHRGCKGTEFLLDALRKLKEEGLKVELILLEKKQNDEVKDILRQEVDLLVEQLIFTGHGFNAVEGMASGLPVLSNLEDDGCTAMFRRWSFLSECPIVSACPENLVEVLRGLVTRPELRRQLGEAGRKYVEKYHGYEAAQYLFGQVIEYLYGRRDSLINLYHPLLGEYPKLQPKVEHPLVNNQIVD